MLFYTIGQSQIFLAMVYAGMSIGLFYDILRLIRYMLTAGRALSLALDLIFGVGSAILLIAFMMEANYAELRLYALLGAFCGLILYAFTISPVVIFMYRNAKKGLSHIGALLERSEILKKVLK